MENLESRYCIVEYTHDYEVKWDDFVKNESINGTFLHTRRFLNYHPDGRFEDYSLIILDKKKNIVAVCPACIQYEDGKRVFFSHKGSTYGGIVIGKRVYTTEKSIEIVEIIEKFLVTKGFGKIIYKNTPEIFCKENERILEYALYYKNYIEEKELNLQIDFEHYKEDIISNLAQGKRTNVHNCEKAGLQLKKLELDEEIEDFYRMLSITLQKYSLKPIHTIKELILLKNTVLKEECEFFGLYKESEFIAGAMMFYFKEAKVAHTQYLCSLPEYNKLSPITYMYYSMIVEMKKRGFKKVSWGISTEHGGKVVNMGLTKNKEAFGSTYSINRIYFKEIMVK